MRYISFCFFIYSFDSSILFYLFIYFLTFFEINISFRGKDAITGSVTLFPINDCVNALRSSHPFVHCSFGGFLSSFIFHFPFAFSHSLVFFFFLTRKLDIDVKVSFVAPDISMNQV